MKQAEGLSIAEAEQVLSVLLAGTDYGAKSGASLPARKRRESRRG